MMGKPTYQMNRQTTNNQPTNQPTNRLPLFLKQTNQLTNYYMKNKWTKTDQPTTGKQQPNQLQ